MTSTQDDESGNQVAVSGLTKRFVMSPKRQPESVTDDDAEIASSVGAGGALMGRKTAIGGVCMGTAALLCFVVAAGFSGGAELVSEETSRKVIDLREQITQAEAHAEALPTTKDAARGLVTAQTSADEIAKLQNDYRYLTPTIAAADGVIDPDATAPTQRNLTPYFTPSVDHTVLEPWYLLASDKDVPAGVGIPMSFDSGFEWVAQRPYLINDDSTVSVTWLAVQTRPAQGQEAAVLAWTRADYDMTRKTFSHVQTGTTTTGQALQQEVRTK